MTTKQTVFETTYIDLDQAQEDRDRMYRTQRQMGQIVHRHVNKNLEDNSIEYVVDIVRQRYVYKVVPRG